MARKPSSHEIEKPARRSQKRGAAKVQTPSGLLPNLRASGKQVHASGIPVHCSFSQIVPALELKPHPDNAKLHPAKQLDRYEKVVVGNGWRRPVVVSSLSGCIVKGHGAWQMANRRGWMLPVEIQRYATAAEERRDMLADNKLAELAETDDEKLAKLLASLGVEDLELTGFDSAELEKMLEESNVEDGDFPITAKLNERYDYALVFCDNESDFVFLQTLLGLAQEKSYKKTGVGIGRAISFQRFLKAIRENRHSLDVQGEHHDHRPTAPKRGGVRAKKPVR